MKTGTFVQSNERKVMHTLVLVFSRGSTCNGVGSFAVHSQQVPGFTSKEEADAAGEEALKGMKGELMGVSYVSVEVK